MSTYCVCTSAVAAVRKSQNSQKAACCIAMARHEDVYVISYRAGVATYRTNMRSLNVLQAKKPALEAIYFYEPQIFHRGDESLPGEKLW